MTQRHYCRVRHVDVQVDDRRAIGCEGSRRQGALGWQPGAEDMSFKAAAMVSTNVHAVGFDARACVASMPVR